MTFAIKIENLPLLFSASSLIQMAKTDPKLFFIWCLIISFLLGAILLLVYSLYLRGRKNQNIDRTKTLHKKYHAFLSEIASGNYSNRALELMSSKNETTLSLSQEDIQSKFHRKTLLKELLSLHKDLAGESAHKLREVYLTLGYKEESINKLKSFKWINRVEGIQELNQMDIKDAYQYLFRLVDDRNALVRLEAILNRIKLDIKPLSLFQELKEDLTDWEQLRIHQVFQQLPIELVPSFSDLLDFSLPSVQHFGIKMIGHFNQAEAEHKLLVKLNHSDQKTSQLILNSLAEIGSEKSVIRIQEIFQEQPPSLKTEMIHCLKKIAGIKQVSFFREQLHLEEYDINLAAAHALIELGNDGENQLEEELVHVDSQTKKIILHAKEWKNN